MYKPVEITQEQAKRLMEIKLPFGLFYYYDGDNIVAIDNTIRKTITNEFKKLYDAIEWLNNSPTINS